MTQHLRIKALTSSPSPFFLTTRTIQRTPTGHGRIVDQINLRSAFCRELHSSQRHQNAQTQPSRRKMTTYNINITSDIVCPWCYVGHARLSKAITNHKKQYPEDKFNLTYRPFYLNPQPHPASSPAFPIPSQPKEEFYAAKFGPARTKQIQSNLSRIASQEGLHFKFGGRTGHSRNGHRLVYYAQTHGDGEKSQNNVMLGLWRRYFEQEKDITDLEVLVETGVEAGLGNADEIRKFLVSGQDGAEVDRIADESRYDGISGVPFYLVQDQWAIEGAQEPRAFESLFLKWKQQNKSSAVDVNVNGSEGNKVESCL